MEMYSDQCERFWFCLCFLTCWLVSELTFFFSWVDFHYFYLTWCLWITINWCLYLVCVNNSDLYILVNYFIDQCMNCQCSLLRF
jgi:hypothetical protein